MTDLSKIQALIEKIRIVSGDADLMDVMATFAPNAIDRPLRIAFVNAHAFNLCYSDENFLNDLLACDYVFRDGAGMKILYQLAGRDEGLNMNGTDFIPRLLSLYKGENIALMGTDSPYLEKAAVKIADMGTNVVLQVNGFQDDSRYGEALRESPAKFVLLAMGMPKQERVAAKIAQGDGMPRLIVCGGAILDFIAEKVPRAPEMYRRYGMEWLYRLKQEPRRLFKRYVIGNAVFLWRAFRLTSQMKQERRRAAMTDHAKPKILHVVRQYAPAIGGLESYVQNMARHQKAMGYDCEVLTLNKVFHGDGAELPAEETIEGVKVKRVPFFGRRRFFIPLISPLYFGRFDVVHVHNTDVFYDYIALVAAVTRTPCFATTHGGFFHTQDFSLIKKLYFNTITRFSSLFYKTIFAISQNDYDTFKSLNKNVVLQHNAIEPLGNDIYTGSDFLYIGRLAQHKNVDQAIKVFSGIKKQGIPGKFHIIGPEWDVTIDSLKQTAANEGVANDVMFHGAASSEQMREVARSCGYFMSGSSFEGFGMSMLEATSVGLVPLVHRNKSFEELVEQSGVGLLADFNDPKAAADSVVVYLPSVNEAQRAQAQAFSRKFSWRTLVDAADKHYRDAV